MRRILGWMAIGIAVWGMAFAYGALALAQSVPPVPHDVPSGIGDLTFAQVMVLLSNFGIGGLVLAIQAKNAQKMGDLATAQQKAKLSTILAAVGIGVGLLGGVVSAVLRS